MIVNDWKHGLKSWGKFNFVPAGGKFKLTEFELAGFYGILFLLYCFQSNPLITGILFNSHKKDKY